MEMQHNHSEFFREETAVSSLQALLKQHNILSHTDKILYSGHNDPRYRVFVMGKAIFATRTLLGMCRFGIKAGAFSGVGDGAGRGDADGHFPKVAIATEFTCPVGHQKR